MLSSLYHSTWRKSFSAITDPSVKTRPDPINHSNANIFNGSQKVFVGNEIPERFQVRAGQSGKTLKDLKHATIKQRLANMERPPDCAAVRSSDVLAQVVQKDPVSADKKE